MTLTEILLIFGGVPAISIAAAVYISKLVQERLLMSWRHKYELAMADYRNSIQRHDLLLNQAFATLNQATPLIAAKKIEIAERFWPEYLAHQSSFNMILGIFTIYFPSIIEKLYDSEFKRIINEKNSSEILGSVGSFAIKFQGQRPLIGESLWQTVMTAASYYTMVAHGVVETFKAKKLVPWTQDKASLEILQKLVSTEEYNHLINLQPASFNIVSRTVDAVVLREFSRYLSNEEIAKRNYETSKQFLDVQVAAPQPPS